MTCHYVTEYIWKEGPGTWKGGHAAYVVHCLADDPAQEHYVGIDDRPVEHPKDARRFHYEADAWRLTQRLQERQDSPC